MVWRNIFRWDYIFHTETLTQRISNSWNQFIFYDLLSSETTQYGNYGNSLLHAFFVAKISWKQSFSKENAK